EVALARDREAGLDHVDAEPLELPRERELLADVHAAARRLLAVAQRGVEDPYAVGHRFILAEAARSRAPPSWASLRASRPCAGARAIPRGRTARRRPRSRTASRSARRARAGSRSPRARACRTSGGDRAPCCSGTESGSPSGGRLRRPRARPATRARRRS